MCAQISMHMDKIVFIVEQLTPSVPFFDMKYDIYNDVVRW